MTVKLEWVPAIEASDRQKAGWVEVELHGGIEAAPWHFLMASPVEEVAKVECPNCKQPVDFDWRHREITYGPVSGSFPGGPYLCEPVQPEPAAPVEMPEVVADALIALRSGAFPNLANDLESFWRSQPVAVGISEELDRRAVEIGGDRLVGVSYRPVSETVAVGTWQLEELLKYADLAEVALRTGFHPPEFLFRPADRSLRQVIDAVKKQRDEQRTHAQPVGITEELESVIHTAEKWIEVEGMEELAEEQSAAIAAVRSQYRRKG